MANSIIQTRIDSDVKNGAEKILDSLGITLNEGIRMFLSQVRIDRGLPFIPRLSNEPNEETIRVINETNANKDIQSFKSKEELFKDLDI
ncbi:MAG: type II toxin-antitoxin system RelB/DinJ family antitoxin [Endomicrobium sp.]|nr:type II toxin-antitoxin system RelB/DinJ family antitoxin [Endomicrobium sp.]